MGIETICEGGTGGSARVFIQLRNTFPGLGGMVQTEQDFVVAYRVPLGYRAEDLPEGEGRKLNPGHWTTVAKEAFEVFLRHVIVKKLDDYFFRKGYYRFAHIPRPLGSTDFGGYMYEWVHGTEGFYTEYYEPELNINVPVEIDEWNVVSNHFYEAGISIHHDTTDALDGRYTKNIIIQEPYMDTYPTKITKLWKRIDFGPESLPIDFIKLRSYIQRYREDMINYLKPQRVRMLELIIEYFLKGKDNGSWKKMMELKKHILDFRISTAEHMGIQGISSMKALKKCRVENIATDNGHLPAEKSFSRLISKSDNSIFELEIRSGFRCKDGVIYTLQEIPVGRVTIINEDDPDIGFKLFLRHFIAKKLENAYISEGRYTYAHISRPLGSEGRSYYYDWAWGEKKCLKRLLELSKPGNKNEGLDQWCEFVRYFNEAGIDFSSRLEFVHDTRNPSKLYAKNIIVRQPHSKRENVYISRLWKRVNFHERSTSFDYKKLYNYLIKNKRYLKKYLTTGRYETMLLAVRYLGGERLFPEDFRALIAGVHSYRVSALRHLNHYGFGPPPEGFVDLKVT